MTAWSSAAIRNRREQLGLSQTDVAHALGVSKSFLSHIEAGNRHLTGEQVDELARVLRIPPALLELAAGRLPDDVRDAVVGNAAEVVAAVRQRTEAQAVSYPRTPQQVPLPKGATRLRPNGLPERIDAQKTSTSYRAHSYHTKVPPEAIRPFIQAYSAPGDLVLDPFCGSGMTGVAALLEGRHALLSDLSPAAVHIARNYTTSCDPAAFAAAYERVAAEVSPTMEWLYRPIGGEGLVEYTTWSDVYRCPQCLGRLVYWDAIQRTGLVTADRVSCPRCFSETRKGDLEWIGEEPVQSQTSSGSNRIHSHAPTRHERALVEQAATAPIPYWVPEVTFGPEREMWRAGHRNMGIDTVGGFFTRRNLHALAALRHAIVAHSEGRVREALMFAFTAAVNRASRRYQWNAKRPTNVMTGTLYISSLRYEWNVWSLFRRKAADVLRYYSQFPNTQAQAEVFQRSAADLGCVPDRAIDFVFMDPPFGANIFYADSSLLWEAWLGQLTDESAEIVVNKSRPAATGGKSISDYGELMAQAFGHVSRVLRPGGRAVLAFSNSDDAVWRSIQEALKAAGLESERVHVLNKGQPSIKGVKGVTGREHVTTLDLMLCLTHRSKPVAVAAAFPPPATLIDQVVREALKAGGGRNDEIYSAVVRAALAGNYSVEGITMPAIAAKCAELGAVERDGVWTLGARPDAARQGEAVDFVQAYLTPEGDYPTSQHKGSASGPLPAVRVSGGRGSPFYLAHSYHTKVPPEAIAPFIAHHTKPGDVVLDPFCGSGMTGVAAALAGRRAILNDLSPAAVHLAWNHTRPCDPDALAEAFGRLAARLQPTFAALYGVGLGRGRRGLAHWTLWSTEHRCPKCARKFLLWEVMDSKTGRLGRTIPCPGCKTELKRGQLETLGSAPAWIAYEDGDGRRGEKAATAADVTHARSFTREDIAAWWPDNAVAADREMYIRCALQLQGVRSIADFYTPRNLRALALLWAEIMAEPDERLRRGLAFAFTNTAWHGTRMRRFNARGGQRPLTGTLYIPQLSSEANVLEVMRNKIAQLQRYYRSFTLDGTEPPAVRLGSATDLADIADGSVDYIFTDPPFGSNIFYADCNLIWESWLGRLTETGQEAVVNRSLSREKGGKTLATYTQLMSEAMHEMARVLKPGGWATVVFHNTDAEVWQSIRDAAAAAGFSFHQAASLDRQQQSHKGYKGRSGEEDVAHFDVVFNLRKEATPARKRSAKAREVDLEALVEQALRIPESARHGLQGVHAEIMRRLASQGSEQFVDYGEVRAIYDRLTRTVAVG